MSALNDTALAEWRKAMKGVTPGDWRKCGGMTPAYSAIYSDGGYIVFGMADKNVHTEGKSRLPIKAPNMDTQQRNAAWIARCSPAGVSELIDSLEAMGRELAEARAENDALNDKLNRKTAECDVWRIEAEDLKAIDANAEWVRLDKILSEEIEARETAERQRDDAMAALRVEQEACALIADRYASAGYLAAYSNRYLVDYHELGRSDAGEEIAAAIRARSVLESPALSVGTGEGQS